MLLDKGIVQSMNTYVPDLYLVFNELNRKLFLHNRGKPLATPPDSLLCKNISPKFIEKLNNGVTEMAKISWPE
jgi:hypothetical protein